MKTDSIAITGVSALFPGSTDTDGFWRDILAGRDLITEVPPTHWRTEDYFDPDPSAVDRTYCRRGAFLSSVPFDPLAYGVPPNILPATDTAQLLALIVAQRVLEDATRSQFHPIDRDRVSVILGTTGTTELIAHMGARLERPAWEEALREIGFGEDQIKDACDRIAARFVPWQENTFPGMLGNVIAGRIANRLNLGGTNCVVDAACASSLAAVSMAVGELATGGSDLVIVGGVDALNVPLMYLAFSKTGALSRNGDCRPFDETADGTVLGEGLGMLALRRLADAERDGDRIYAVLRAVGTSSDGRAKSIYAPVPAGQAKAVRRSYQAAGYSPATVELIEAHGTGTKAGDVAEFDGLSQVFNEAGRAERQWCAIGSVKSQIGHAKAGAGIAGLFKAVMALHHKVLPPTIKVQRPNPTLKIEQSPFYINSQARPWIRDASHPRRASVSSFGFGGTNFHLALEEYVGAAPRPQKIRCSPSEVLIWSGRTLQELQTQCQDAIARLEKPNTSLDHFARAVQQTYQHELPLRAAIVVEQGESPVAKISQLLAALKAGTSSEPGPGIYLSTNSQPGRIGFLFPGQGSQYVNMGSDLALTFDVVRHTWDRVACLDFQGERLHQVVFPRPAFSDNERQAQSSKLTATEWAQPALGICSFAVFSLLKQLGVQPDCVAGHSFGELSALAAAGSFGVEELIRAARKRGELMAAGSPRKGAMLAVLCAAPEVERALGGMPAGVVIANYNSPRQVVLSGEATAIAAAEKRLAAASLTCKQLPVSTAFHSELVASAVSPFQAFLQTINPKAPRLPVYACATGKLYPANAPLTEVLSRQLAEPVRFLQTIEDMYASGVRTFVEVGVGSVLTGLVGDTLRGKPHLALSLDRKGQNGLSALHHALARLAVQGVPVRWDGLWEEFAPPSIPEEPKKHAVLICGANYGKPPLVRQSPPPVPRSLDVAVSEISHAAAPSHEKNGDLEGNETPTIHSAARPLPNREDEVMPPPAVALPAAWAEALRSILEETSATHRAYQQLAADNHRVYLETVERTLQKYWSVEPATTPVTQPAETEHPVYRNVTPPTSERYPTAGVVEKNGHGDSYVMAAAPSLPSVLSATANPLVEEPTTVAPTPPVLPKEEKRSAEPSSDLRVLLLQVVADKTGYPSELLDLDMEIEAGLGIDSIKRVEILSALESKIPALQGVDPSLVFALHTLRDVLQFLAEKNGTPTPTPASNPVAIPQPTAIAASVTAKPASTSTQEHAHLKPLLLEVVADKTGYPAELLDLDMEIEAGLGIDSIKRVEILSALESKIPALQGVDPSLVFALHTLGDVLNFLAEKNGIPTGTDVQTDNRASSVLITSDLGRSIPRLVDAPSSGFTMPGLLSLNPLFLVAKEGEEGEDLELETALALAALLRAQGVAVEVGPEVPPDAQGVIFLGGLRRIRSIEDALTVQREAFRAARAITQQRREQEGLFVTIQDTGGDFGFGGAQGLQSWLGGLPALVKTLAHEWPAASVRAIDLEGGSRGPELLAEAIHQELLHGGIQKEVALRLDNSRKTIACDAAAFSAQPVSLPTGLVTLVSGGARGVTATSLLEFARHTRPRLILLGRTPLSAEPACCHGLQEESALNQALLSDAKKRGTTPSLAEIRSQVKRILAVREIEQNLASLKQAGAEVRYLPVDVLDLPALRRELATVRQQWGPIGGLIHAAGVLADKLLRDKSDEQFESVFQTKVDGFRNLLEATANDPLRLLCCFSSVAARVGNRGQSDYAMANDTLNKVATLESRKRGAGCTVRSLNWGAWEGGMVTPALKAHFNALGVPLISLEEGGRALLAELLQPGGSVEVVLGSDADPATLLPQTNPKGTIAEILVDQHRYPFLTSHCVDGVTPVLPSVLVLEWFVRLGQAYRADLEVDSCRDFRVLSGVTLSHPEVAQIFRLVTRTVTPQADGGLTLAVDLVGQNQMRHYTGNLELRPRTRRKTTSIKRETLNGFAWPWSIQQVYGDRLFHGPAFQVIRSLDSLAETSAVGTLSGTDEKGWQGGPWLVNPAAIDGGMQLALLWALQHKGRKSLPTGIKAFVPARLPVSGGLLRCEIRVRQASSHEILADVLLIDTQGQVVAELQELTMTLLRQREGVPVA